MASASLAASRLEAPPAGRTGCAAMLDAAEPLADAHVAVLCAPGTVGIDTLCALIGRGCSAASELAPDARMTVEPVEVVLVPDFADLAQAALAIQLARRSLLPCGRIVLRDRGGHLAAEIVALLRSVGFSNIRRAPSAEGVVVSADRPMFGPRFGVARHA